MWRPGELAEKFAEQILQHVGLGNHRANVDHVVDVHLVADRLGITRLPAPIKEDGRLVISDGRPFVTIKEGLPWVRERFTLAHEISHWALRADDLASDLTNAVREAFISEEMLCDAVAGALLMPAQPTRSAFRWARSQRNQTLLAVYAIAAQTQASLGAVTVRARDLFGWRRSLLHFVALDGNYTFDSEAGVYPWEEGRICSIADTEWELRRLSANGTAVQALALPFAVDDTAELIPAEVVVTHERALVFMHLGDAFSTGSRARRSSRP